MKILQKKRDGHPQSRIEKRVAKISTPDLIQWMEHSMYTIGKCITEWQKSPNSDALLDEVEMGAEAFLAIAKELKRRK